MQAAHAGWVRGELAALLGPGADAGALEQIKRKRTRAVFRVEREGAAPVYLKWGRPRAPYDRLRGRLWPSRLATEWARLFDLRERGVPTPEPIAYGQRRRAGLFAEEWLALGEVRGPTLSAHAAAGFPAGPGIPAALAGAEAPRAVGRWVRTLHDAGVLHTDFHAQNVIVSPDAGTLALIDVDDVVVGRAPGLDARARSLAQLLRRGMADAQQRALLEAYAEADADGPRLDVEALCEAVALHRERDDLRFRRHRVRRSLAGTSQRFENDLCGEWRLRTRRTHDRGAAHAALRAVGPALADVPDGSLVPAAGGGQTWLCHRPRTLGERVRSLLGRSAAVRAWRGALALEAWRLPGPRCVALARPGRLRAAARASAVLFEDEGAVPLGEALAAAVDRGPEAADALAARVGRYVGTLHRAGLAVTDGPRVGDLEVVDDGEPAVRLSARACRRVVWSRRLAEREARHPASHLAREVANLAGDGVGGRLDAAYRDAVRRPRKPDEETSVPPARIAIVKTGAIGDVVNTLPLAVRLRERFPDARIAWVVGPAARPVLEGHPAIDRIIDFPRHRYLRRVPRMLRELRAFRPDMTIDAGRQLKSALIAFASGARRRLGLDRTRAKENSWMLNNERLPPTPGRGLVLEHYLEMARALGCPEGPPRWDLPPPPDAARAHAARLLEGAREPVVAVAVGASKRANHWPAHRLAAVCARVRERGGTPVLVGDRTDRSRAALVAALAGPGVGDLTGRTDLKQLAALFERCRAVVGQDSGPLHLAAALGRPTVGIFGAANPLRTGPWGRLDAVRRIEIPCAPCGKRDCRLGTRACMGLLEADPVLAALDDVLETRRPAPAAVPEPDLEPARRHRGPWRIEWDPERPPGTLTDRLHALGALFESERMERFNVCATAVTGRWKDPEVGPLFVKHYRKRSRTEGLRNLFRESRGRHAWRAGRRLVEMGVPTGRPLALAERRSGGSVVESFVVTEEVRHAGDVLEYFRDRACGPGERARFTRALALHLRDLHDRGIYPRDCKGTNLLVCEHGGALAFAHIDLDRQEFRRVGEADAIRNLVYLNTSFGDMPKDRDRLRFLRAYLGRDFRDRARVRRMADAVRRGTAERLPRRPPPLGV